MKHHILISNRQCKRIHLLLFIYCKLALCPVSAQIILSGHVRVKSDNSPVELAIVKLSLPDSTQQACLSDYNGEYRFSGLKPGDYKVSISALGYVTQNSDINIFYPSFGSELQKDYYLEEELLDGAIITASTKKQFADKTVYYITDRERNNRVNGIEIIQSLPKLFFNEVSQKLTTPTGGAIKILIDGANASEIEVKALSPEQIKSIEYFDFPSSLYAGYSSVVNVITKYRNSGLIGNFGAQHSFTTGFANDDALLKYNWKNNQIAIVWQSFYRNYKQLESSSAYSYLLNTERTQRKAEDQYSYGYHLNNFNLSFTHNDPSSFFIQVSFKPSLYSVHSEGTSTIDFIKEEILSERKGLFSSRTGQFTPTVDILSKIKLSSNEELLLNTVGTFFAANSIVSTNEDDLMGNTVFVDNVNQRNDKYSFYNGAEYSFSKNERKHSIGCVLSYNNLSSSIINSFDNTQYRMRTFNNTLFAQSSGVLYEDFIYTASVRLDHYSQQHNDDRLNEWNVHPVLLLGYNIADNTSLRVIGGMTKQTPTLSQLSDNKVFVTEEIVKEGNPNLKSSTSRIVGLLFDYNNKWLNISIGANYSNEINPISTYYVNRGNYIGQAYENGIYRTEHGISADIKISPFEQNYASFMISSEVTKIKTESAFIGIYSYLYVPFMYTIDLRYKNAMLSYVGNIPGYVPNGAYLESEEKHSTLAFRYNWKNFTFSMNAFWLFTNAEYHSKTFSNSIVNYDSVRNIIDNRNMITLGVSYRFNVGKEFKDNQNLTSYSDTDSGILL